MRGTHIHMHLRARGLTAVLALACAPACSSLPDEEGGAAIVARDVPAPDHVAFVGDRLYFSALGDRLYRASFGGEDLRLLYDWQDYDDLGEVSGLHHLGDRLYVTYGGEKGERCAAGQIICISGTPFFHPGSVQVLTPEGRLEPVLEMETLEPRGAVAVAGAIYWYSGATGALRRFVPGVGLEDLPPTDPSPAPSPSQRYLVVVDGAVHILKSSPAESRVALYRLAGTALELVSDVAAPAPSGRPVAGPDRVVWTTASQIVALQPSTGEVRVVADASGEIDLAAGASHLYWTHRAAGEVRRYSYTTGEVELFAAGQPGAMRVFAGDSRVVWYNADSANLVSLPLSPP